MKFYEINKNYKITFLCSKFRETRKVSEKKSNKKQQQLRIITKDFLNYRKVRNAYRQTILFQFIFAYLVYIISKINSNNIVIIKM